MLTGNTSAAILNPDSRLNCNSILHLVSSPNLTPVFSCYLTLRHFSGGRGGFVVDSAIAEFYLLVFLLRLDSLLAWLPESLIAEQEKRQQQ